MRVYAAETLIDTVTGSFVISCDEPVMANSSVVLPIKHKQTLRINESLNLNKTYRLRFSFKATDYNNTSGDYEHPDNIYYSEWYSTMYVDVNDVLWSGQIVPVTSFDGLYQNVYISDIAGTVLSATFDCSYYAYYLEKVNSDGYGHYDSRDLPVDVTISYNIDIYETDKVMTDDTLIGNTGDTAENTGQIADTTQEISDNLTSQTNKINSSINSQTNKIDGFISDQTDAMTNGFNSSAGDNTNNMFSSGVDDYQVAEDSLFVSAKTGLNDFEFYNLESVPAMLTGISFVGSVMTSLYDQAGGVSGIGIVLSILFSVMIAAMALGLYRWYQSRGGKK